MDSMVIHKNLVIKRRLSLRRRVVTALSLLALSSTALAIDFRYTPSLTIQETYSDNIRLAPKGREQGAFVTEITPGITIQGYNGGRLTANLNYRMQNLFNAGGDGSTRINHQLQFNSGYRIMRRSLFVEARGTYSQQNISNLRGGDNINNLGNRTNVWTAGTSINWTPHFGSLADAVVRVNFDYVGNDSAGVLANAMNVSESVRLTSGRDFKRFTWNVNFNNTNNIRNNADDVQFQNVNGSIRAWYDRYFNVFATLGYANNQFQGLEASNTSNNGFFYTVGAQWKPNWYFDVEAGYGNNWHITSNLSLSRRTRLSFGYFDRSVGLNTGGAWNASANHITKRSSWNFTYSEDTTTVQQILLEDTPFAVVDATGNPVLGDDGQPIIFNSSLPTLNNDVLVRKTANISVTYTTGKSSFQLGSSYQRREFENSNNDQQTVYGVDGSWNWQFSRRTGIFLSPSWQRIAGDVVNDPSANGLFANQDRYQFVARLTRTIPFNIGRSRLLNASLEYRFVKQDGEQVIVEGVDLNNSYIENRVSVSLFMSF